MKLRGEFVVRQVADDIIAIPVGNTALEFNGMIMLNDVSRVIWECLEKGTEITDIVSAVTEKFEVLEEEAKNDIIVFLDGLRKINMLEEN